MNLEQRLRKALAALEELNAPQPHVYRRPDEERLRGKIEGVKLALSYLKEETKESEFGLGTLVNSGGRTFRVTGIGGNSSYLHCLFEMVNECGDYPAPCNCDDPRTHNGH